MTEDFDYAKRYNKFKTNLKKINEIIERDWEGVYWEFFCTCDDQVCYCEENPWVKRKVASINEIKELCK